MNELLRTILFLPHQSSTIARDLDYLHYFVILTTMAGATLVTVVGGYFCVRYRRRGEDLRGPHPNATVRPPLSLEVAALVGLITLFLVWWWVGLQQYVRVRVAPTDSMEVYVTAKQWMWKFGYPQGSHSIATLYVPAGRPVKLIMTSRDVIHSFYVPDFRVKQDVVPGRYTTIWFEAKEAGTYPILCTEYCGNGHSTMRGEVIALVPRDFERWLGSQPAVAPVAGQRYTPPYVVGQAQTPEMIDLAREGERVSAEQGCLRCHSLDGSPHIGPTWAGMVGSRVPLEGGGSAIADEAYLTESMMDPMVKVHAGFQPVMPSFQGRLQPAEVASILELMKALRDVRPQPGGRDRPAAQEGSPAPAAGSAPRSGR